MKKFISVILAVIIISLSCITALGVESAYDAAWQSYYESTDNTLPLLTPGADETELYIQWHAAVGAPDGIVRIATNSALTENTVDFSAKAVEAENDTQKVNRVIVTGLTENTVYYYSYTLDNGEMSIPCRYVTHSFSDYSVLVTTDAQIGPSVEAADKLVSDSYKWNTSLNAALAFDENISFALHTGDQAQLGLAEEWKGFYLPPALRSLPIATVIGNHDKKNTAYKYYTFYPNAYDMDFPSTIGSDNWFSYGSVLYVIFDSTNGSAKDHYGVAKQAVEANPDAKWIIGAMHHDLNGGTDSADSLESTVIFDNIFRPIFDEFDFDIVFTGHSHSYSRSHQMYGGKVVRNTSAVSEVTDPEGTVYISTCCAGNKYDNYDVEPHSWTAYRFEEKESATTLLNVTEDSLSVNTYRNDNGEVLDTYTITKTASYLGSVGDGIALETDSWYNIVKVLGSLYELFVTIGNALSGMFA